MNQPPRTPEELNERLDALLDALTANLETESEAEKVRRAYDAATNRLLLAMRFQQLGVELERV